MASTGPFQSNLFYKSVNPYAHKVCIKFCNRTQITLTLFIIKELFVKLHQFALYMRFSHQKTIIL